MIKFRVNIHNWQITFASPEDTDTEFIHGFTDYSHHMILINNDLEESEMESTIIHEVTHAYRYSHGFILDVDNTKLTSQEIEEVISNFVECFGRQIVEVSNDLYNKLKKELKNEKKL